MIFIFHREMADLKNRLPEIGGRLMQIHLHFPPDHHIGHFMQQQKTTIVMEQLFVDVSFIGILRIGKKLIKIFLRVI